MSFTFSTLLSMIIINAVFVIALNQVVKTSVINYFNIDLFLLSSLVILLRFLLPFEFPFTVSVPVKWGLSYLYDLFVMLEINILGHPINIFTIFMIAWYIGILICGSRLFLQFATIRQRYRLREAAPDSDAYAILHKITSCHQKSKAVFRIYITPRNITPFIYGIFHPVIVLPDSVHSKEELFYILSHETAHYYNHHTLYKFLCSLLEVIYFWNPLVKIFVKEINRIIEISVDSKVIAPLEPLGRLDYSRSLTSMARTLAEKKTTLAFTATYSSTKTDVSRLNKSSKTQSSKKPSSLSQRIQMIIGSPDKIKTLAPNGLVSSLLLIGALMISLIFVFEPYRICNENEVGTFTSETRNLFYIINTDGTYDLYLDGKYFATESEILDSSIPIYDSFPNP